MTICNGTTCATFKYVKLSGQWQQVSPEVPDEHDQDEYRNTAQRVGGGGAGGYYYWGGSLWIYFGSSGCIGCVYFGQVGDPIPVPDSREEP